MSNCFYAGSPMLVKGKGRHAITEALTGSYLPFLALQPVPDWTTEVCSTWPVRCRTCGHLAELNTNTHMQKRGSTTVLNLKIFLTFTFIKHRNPLQELTQYPTNR